MNTEELFDLIPHKNKFFITDEELVNYIKEIQQEINEYKTRCEKANKKLNELDFDNFVYSKAALKDIKKNLQNILNGGK